MKCPTCGETDLAGPSSPKCLCHVKSKIGAYQEFIKTLVIKADLKSACKNANKLPKVQNVVPHTTQVVYAKSVFANCFCLDQVKNKQASAAITHSLVNQFLPKDDSMIVSGIAGILLL